METRVLREVAGVTRLDCMRSEDIRIALKQEAVVTQVKRRREWWQDKAMENHSSLTGKVMRGQGRERDPEEDREKDGVMISEECNCAI